MSDEHDPQDSGQPTMQEPWTPAEQNAAATPASVPGQEPEASTPASSMAQPVDQSAPSPTGEPEVTGSAAPEVTGGAGAVDASHPTVATPAHDPHDGLFQTSEAPTVGAGSPSPWPASGESVSASGATTPPVFPPPAAPGAATPSAAGAPAPKKNGFAGKAIAVGAAAGLIAGLAGGAVGYRLSASQDASSSGQSSLSQNEPSNSDDLSPRATNSVSAIADKILPSVVNIEVSSNAGSGTGSGFIIREDGFILTNNHVVESAANGGEITVTFDDQTSKRAQIAGRSPEYDLAVIKVDATGLPAVTLGDSETVKVGDTAIAVGSPLGLAGTVTSGIISALDRPVTAGSGQQGSETSFINAIQTDASINPGNSGGPLVNGEGQVIGVNSAIASNTGGNGGQAGSIGLGFAIPINTAKRVGDELIKSGKSETPIIGASIKPQATGEGAEIAEVVPGGPAEKAGIKAGDVITAVNGEPITDQADLITTIRSFAPGQQVTLTVNSGGQSRDITVTLGVKNTSQ